MKGNLQLQPLNQVIYFDTKTQNVARFVSKFLEYGNFELIDINSQEHFDKPGHLVTYTTGSGQIPVTTEYFMSRNNHLIHSISSSGNRNWGNNFGIAADKIAEQYSIPVLLKFELSGLDGDLTSFIDMIAHT